MHPARQPLRVARACPYSLAGLSFSHRPNLQQRFLLALAAWAGPAVGQAATALWSERAEVAQKALVECFWNEDAGLCEIAFPSQREEPHFHYWWQAHAIDVLVDGFERSGNREYLARATKLWDGVKRRHGGVTIDYYDDMLWMGIALQRLQAHTGDARQRGDVNTLWTDIKLGWSEAQGGGIAWSKLHPQYKNTPANAPAVILGVRLHRQGGDEADLVFAKQVYEWLEANLVDPETGFVWDGKNRQGDGKIDKAWAFTYNQGVRIGAGVELYRATNDVRYLADAKKTFVAMRARLTNANGVLVERGKGDGGLFKGILVRYVGEWIALLPKEQDQEREFLRRQAESLWSHLPVGAGTAASPCLFSADWNQPAGKTVELSVQLSGMMLAEQMARLERGAASTPEKKAETRRAPR